MDKILFESLMKSLYEAIELAESKCVIRTLQPNEKLPMDLLLLADPSETSIEKYIHKSKVFVAVEDALVVGVYVLMEIASEQLAKHDEMTKFSIPLGDPKKRLLTNHGILMQ